MTYDFSSKEKIAAFKKQLDSNWDDPLPNFKWIDQEAFSKGLLFTYSADLMFTRAFGGNQNKLPTDMDQRYREYGKCFLMWNMSGYTLLSNRKRLYFGTFAYCEHKATTSRRLGNCWNEYTCKTCGFTWDVDSSG